MCAAGEPAAPITPDGASAIASRTSCTSIRWSLLSHTQVVMAVAGTIRGGRRAPPSATRRAVFSSNPCSWSAEEDHSTVDPVVDRTETEVGNDGDFLGRPHLPPRVAIAD